MTYSEELVALAQIAIGLAGFSGIVVALERRPSRGPSPSRHALLRELLLGSLGVVFFAFLPPLLEGAFGNAGGAWRASALALGGYHGLLMAMFFRTLGRAEIVNVTLVEWTLVPGGIGVIVLLCATGVGLLPDHLRVAYLLGILWLLLVASLDFVVLLLHGEKAA